jgi:hypothetical protein
MLYTYQINQQVNSFEMPSIHVEIFKINIIV